MRFEVSPAAGARGRAKLIDKATRAVRSGEHVGVMPHYEAGRVVGSALWRLDDSDLVALGTGLTDWLATGPEGLICGRNIIEVQLGGLGVSWMIALTGCRAQIAAGATHATTMTWNSGVANPPAELRPQIARPASHRP